MSYQDTHQRGLYPSMEMQSVYSTVLDDWVKEEMKHFILFACY